MQFIVEQQAQLTAKMQRHDDAIAEMEKSRVKTEQEIQTATNLIGRLASAMTELTERTGLLTQREDKFEVRMDLLARRIENLAELQAGTEERLNSFFTFVGNISAAGTVDPSRKPDQGPYKTIFRIESGQ